MKRIFTLLFSLLITGATFAQSAASFYYTPGHAIIVNVSNRHYDEAFSFTRYERDLRIAKINEEYSRTMRTILNMRFITVAQKIKLIQEVEFKKTQQLNAVRAHFFNER